MSLRHPMSWVAPLALALCSFGSSSALGGGPPRIAATIRGVVFEDANSNGTRESGERGLPGVVGSNQRAVALTVAGGEFALPDSGTGVIFASVPDGYRAPRFWQRASDQPLEIGLIPAPKARDFVFVHASDSHVQTSTVGRVDRVRSLVDSVGADLVLFSGDLVRDALRVPEPEARGYYELYRDAIAKFPVPVWSTMGNHENFGIERHLSLVSPSHPLYGRGMYRHYLGPDYYSFNFGGVHFIALNTVDVNDLWYYGHVDSTQMKWLAADLATVPSKMPVVTFDHIPFFTTSEVMHGYNDGPPAPTLIRIDGKDQFRHVVSNAREVLALLWQHSYPLALGGHVHLREAITYGFAGQLTRFEQAAAVVGGSRDGPITVRSGITVYRVHAGVIDSGSFLPLDP